MVICSRCQQPVDETTRTDCPLCFTPLPTAGAVQPLAAPAPAQAPAAPGYAPPAAPGGVMPLNGPAPTPGVMPLNGPVTMPAANPTPSAPLSAPMAAPTLAANQRMTLSGEVIEAPAPMSAQPPPGNSQYNSRPVSGAPRGRETAEKSGGGGAVVPIVALLALVVAGFGGWYYWMHRTNPKDQAQKYMAAIKNLDAKAMYPLIETDMDEKAFIADSESNPAARQIATQLLANMTFTVGEPKYSGSTAADVPVTTKGSISFPVYGQQKTINIDKTADMKMKNFNGIWKVSKDNQGWNSSLSNGGNLLGGLGGK